MVRQPPNAIHMDGVFIESNLFIGGLLVTASAHLMVLPLTVDIDYASIWHRGIMFPL